MEEHCRGCGERAATVAPPGLSKTAYLAGLLHDMGKYTRAFKQYINDATDGNDVHRGSVNHTFAGVRFAMERWHIDTMPSKRTLACELIAFAAGAHHGQYDCVAPDGTDGWQHRMGAQEIGYDEAKGNFLRFCANEEELDRSFAAAEQEIDAALSCFSRMTNKQDELYFYLSMLARLLLSAVIEGDRYDTAKFMQDGIGTLQTHQPLWADILKRVEQNLSDKPANTEINRVRRTISDQCRMAVARGKGIYTLTIPTGGGKTLTALRYALAAAMGGGERIFFIIPLLSVLDQNAKVIHETIGDDSLILEHHSNLLREDNRCEGEKLDANELLSESWNAPIVITTLVQLLNTLLAGKTSCIRRMAALRNSVIVIDEVQSVPKHMLSEFNLVLNFLSGFCGATIVLCSATQPNLDSSTIAHPLQYTNPAALVAHNAEMWRVFRRTKIENGCRTGGYTLDELADFTIQCANQNRSVLVICNTKAEARELYTKVRWQWGGAAFHLSTSMCKAHRAETLNDICLELSDQNSVICIATQLVEAGVDFSFGAVIRVLAGMDNIVQAAGRCNRNGEFSELRPVYIVNLRDEPLRHLPEIRQAQDAARVVLEQYRCKKELFEHDLTGEAAISCYYSSLYAEMKQGGQDYPLPKLNTTLFKLLTIHEGWIKNRHAVSSYTLGQAFKTAGDAFHVFEDDTVDILTPYGEGETIIEELCSNRARYDLAYRQQLIRRAASYSVSLREYELAKLRDEGGISAICEEAVWVLRPEFYADTVGYSPQGDGNTGMEGQDGTQQYCGI